MSYGNRILKVQGEGIVEEKPDTITLSFDIEDKNYIYEKAMGNVSLRTDMLKDNLLEIGIPKSDVKTSSFGINTVYRSIYTDIKNVDGSYKTKDIFDGYKCSHSLRLEFPLDTELLRKAIEKVVSSGIDVEFRIRFTVKDKESLKKRALESAVKDALSKAEIIAKTAGFRLGNVLSVNSERRSIDYYSRNELCMNQMSNMSSAMPDITPEDIHASDHVNIEWEIE